MGRNYGLGRARTTIPNPWTPRGLSFAISWRTRLPITIMTFLRFQEDTDTVAAGERFQFHMNEQGDITSISAALEPVLPDDIVFTRAAEKNSQGQPNRAFTAKKK